MTPTPREFRPPDRGGIDLQYLLICIALVVVIWYLVTRM